MGERHGRGSRETHRTTAGHLRGQPYPRLLEGARLRREGRSPQRRLDQERHGRRETDTALGTPLACPVAAGMVSEKLIYRTASVLIDRHGAKAMKEANRLLTRAVERGERDNAI